MTTINTNTTNNNNTTTAFDNFISGLLARNEVFICEEELSASQIKFLEWLCTETITLPEGPTKLGGAFWVDRSWFGLTAKPGFRTNFYPF
jgi:hypothetical protein